MQENETSMSVADLQKMIHVWKSRHITDSTVSKLLELYLGLTGYMNSQKVYPQENFYEIRNSLRFATTRALVEAVKCSRSFPFVTDPATGAVKAFWSPLYRDADAEIHTEPASGLSAQTFAQTFVPTDNNINNIYNTLSNERTSTGSSSPKDIPSEENSPQEEKSLPNKAEADSPAEFFHRINEDPEQKARIFLPLIGYFQQQEKTDRSQACRTLVCLVNEQLIPYFTAHPQFLNTAHAGRLIWLDNLLKSSYGSRMLGEAMRSSRRKREQEMQEKSREQLNELRSFHPVSPHEWTDRESEQRFYDGHEEGPILIPADAPPRPTSTAQWNVLSREWSFFNGQLTIDN